MADNLLPDHPQTVERLAAVACLLEWMRSMPATTRSRFVGALADGGDAIQQAVLPWVKVIQHPQTTPVERRRALTTIAAALFPNAEEREGSGLDLATSAVGAAAENPSCAGEGQTLDSHQAAFAQRLREVMEAKRISQMELADRVGCSQPAISQLLHRQRRPQKKTIVKLAEALHVRPGDLWPEMEVAEMLDAVAEFQQDQVMTAAEARALGSASRPNRPQIQAKSLPPDVDRGRR